MAFRQGGFSGILNFDDAETQFGLIIVSIIPVLSKNHRNTYSVYNNEEATHVIQKKNAVKYERFQGIAHQQILRFNRVR